MALHAAPDGTHGARLAHRRPRRPLCADARIGTLGRHGRPPGPGALCDLAAATAIGVAAYYALTAAMRTGEVSVVTPFRYTRLVFALGLGVLVFGERPDAATLAGSAIIVASGLYTLIRARRRAQAN